MTSATPTVETGTERASERLVGPLFATVTLAAFVFFFYIGMVVVTVPRLVERELGGGEFGVGLTIASFAIAAVIVRPMLGRLIDRLGRRAVLMAGAFLAAAAGAATGFVDALWQVIALRAVMGIGEAGVFVSAATLVADLAPPTRRAEAASYFSVAVYGGIGIGPLLAEWVLDGDRYLLTFLVAGAFAAVAGLIGVGLPARVPRTSPPSADRPPLFHRAALWPGIVLAAGIGAFSVFSAFIPEHSTAVGLSGAGGLFLVYSVVSVSLRLFGARLPERLGEHVMVSIALIALGISLALLAAVAEPWALWVAAGGVGFGMAFMYPSLMANVINRVEEDERASALSSFTMFFELGTVVGGVALGAVGQIFDKRAAFLGAAIVALSGLSVLWTRVVASEPMAAVATTRGPATA